VEADWDRPGYVAGGGDAFVFFVAFGPLPEPFEVSASRHRVTDVPPFVEVEAHPPAAAASFFTPPMGRILLQGWSGGTAADLARGGCVVVRGPVADPPDLRYLRTVVGLVTALVDGGALAVLNLQALALFSPARWREEIFEPDAPVPGRHVSILESEDADAPGRRWLHTRGMRVFGRPDVSVRNVDAGAVPEALGLCRRLVDAMARGLVVADGQMVEGKVCRSGGDVDDPDFNNLHLSLRWA
jgi:hypothetical protein